MTRALVALVVVLGFTFTLGGEPALLIRLDRRGPSDLSALAADGVPVVLDAQTLLLVHGDAARLAWLLERGWSASVVDTGPGRWDYVQAGLRDDSDIGALTVAGPIVMSAENWVLVRIPAGASLEPLTRAGAFLYRLPRHGIAPPRVPSEPAETRSDFGSPDPIVQKIVSAVSPAQIDDNWLDLTTNPPTGTRFSSAQGCRDSATYCRDVFAGLGLGAELQNWSVSHAPNAIGTRQGAIDPSKVYIVIGHLDDLPSSGPAPGADDNASGTVNVLENARAMNCWAFRNTVKYIACTGEEQGLLGSDAYAQDALNRGEDIRGVINMDMIAWAGNNAPNPENLDLNYNGPSQWLGEKFADAATTYGTGLVVDAFYCPSLTASDHASFWERGWPAVCGITDNEGYCGHAGNYPYYHQSTDTIANCGDKQFFYSVVKTSAATLAELAGAFKISFSKPTYACGTNLTVVLGDRDKDTNPATRETVAVEVWSDTETVPETLVLTERTVHSMIFDAVLPTTTAPPLTGDGLLSVAPGDALHARYVDALDCDGGTNVPYLADARVDCVGPAISAVGTTGVSDTAARIVWTTDEASDSVATWGPVKPPATTTPGNRDTTAHEVSLSGLQSCTVYWFDTRSADGAGNLALADNGGTYFHFETLGNFGSGLQPCHAGRVSIDRPTFACSEAATFRVTDIDLNTNPGVAETVLLQASSTTEPAGEWITATETGPNTSVFAASIPLQAGSPTPGDGVAGRRRRRHADRDLSRRRRRRGGARDLVRDGGAGLRRTARLEPARRGDHRRPGDDPLHDRRAWRHRRRVGHDPGARPDDHERCARARARGDDQPGEQLPGALLPRPVEGPVRQRAGRLGGGRAVPAPGRPDPGALLEGELRERNERLDAAGRLGDRCAAGQGRLRRRPARSRRGLQPGQVARPRPERQGDLPRRLRAGEDGVRPQRRAQRHDLAAHETALPAPAEQRRR